MGLAPTQKDIFWNWLGRNRFCQATHIFMNCKRSTILILLMLAWNFISAQETGIQNRAEISVGKNQIDNNLRIDHSFTKNRHTVSFGLKYNFWHFPVDDQNYLLRQRAYAQNFTQHLGIQAGYRYTWFRTQNGLNLYSFADIQLSRTALWISNYDSLFSGPDPFFPGIVPYFGHETGFRQPISIFEGSAGVGLFYAFSKHIALNEMAGLGLATARMNLGHGYGMKSDGIFPFLRIGIVWIWGKEKQIR